MFITLKPYCYLLLSMITFIGIIFYELGLHPSIIFSQLFAKTRSFAILVKNDEFALLDQKSKFRINNNNNKIKFIYMDYDSRMINGNIPIDSINEITIFSGNKSGKFAATGVIAGFIIPFLLSGGDDDFICISMFTAPGGLVSGAVLGAVTPNINTYQISENDWHFADIE